MDIDLGSEALRPFVEAAYGLSNPAIQNWREAGSKVVGYLCSSTPVEMITAAGLLPFRMRAKGSTDTTHSDAYLGAVNCSFVRHCLDQALQEKYDQFIDGIICVNACTHISRLYDVWRRNIEVPVLHFLPVPRKIGEAQRDYEQDQMEHLKGSLEKHFKVKITDDRLWEAIRLHNETRSLQKRLYEMRKRKRPPLTGAEALAVTIAGTAMPLDQYNAYLRGFLDEIDDLEIEDKYTHRLMIVGGHLDDPDYIKVIEDEGGLVVTDGLCFGSRVMWRSVDTGADNPIKSLAQYYVMDRPCCPRILGDVERRVDYIRDMVKEFEVDGVVISRMQFCEPWGGDAFIINQELKESGIPVLSVEREYLLSSIGQLRTRVQAFLESIGR